MKGENGRLRGKNGKESGYEGKGKELFCFPLSPCFFSLFPFFFSLFFILTVFSGSVEAQEFLRQKLDEESFIGSADEEWKIEALRLTYDHKSKQYEAEGSVRISSRDRLIRADRAQLDTERRQVELVGNVFIQYGNDWLEGNHVIWNLNTETGWIDEGMIFFAKNHFYVSGEEIAKTGATEYELKEGAITTCGPQKPDWSVGYGQMKVNTEGVAWAKHTSFRVRNVPILYFPFVAMPIIRDRQSGFLAPHFAASELNGFETELPFYWAIRRDMDATFYGHYYQKRGWMSGMEFRIANGSWGEGMWLAHYLSDRANKEHLRIKGYPFEQTDRYWVRGRHSFDLPHQIEGRLNVDLVSDRNFLREFEMGSVSYGYTDTVFRKFFGRGVLNDKTILARESNLYLSKRGEDALLGLDVHYWDNLDREQDEFTFQQLPNLTFDIAPNTIGDLPVYYSLDSSWVNYWRREGDQGQRIDMYPRAYYPIHLKSYLNVEPSVGARFTSYRVDWQEQEDDPGKWQERAVPDVRVEMNSRLNRVYQFGDGKGFAVQHAFRPEIIYEYIPDVDQDDLPRFDDLDEIAPRHDVRYGVSNFFVSRRPVKDAEGKSEMKYTEVARLRVSQAYNIHTEPSSDDTGKVDRFVGSPLITDSFDTEDRFSDVSFELDLTPESYINLSYDVDISSKDGSLTRQEIYMNLDSARGQTLSLSYRFRKETVIDELISHLKFDVTPNVSFSTYHDYSFDEKEMFRQGYGVAYRHGCWGVLLGYEREDEDQRVSVSFNLLGLGGIGGDYSIGSGVSTSDPEASN